MPPSGCPAEAAPFLVPAFPRVGDYAGAWAIEPAAGEALARLVRGTDLARHVAAAPPAPAPRAEVQTVAAGNGQQVAVVMLAGTLMKARSSLGGTSTVQARREVRKAAADPDVSAILLAIDSPGGTTAGTADLAADVRAAAKKKPVWAFVDDLGASAAYWVASQADKVFANHETALVGSIGTMLVVYDTSAEAEAAGVKTLLFGTGPLKGAGTPGAAVTEAQQAYYRDLVDRSQLAFDAAVRRGRGLTDRQLADARTGGVFLAAEALERKLIDGIQSFDRTLFDLSAEAGRRARAARPNPRAASPQPPRTVVTMNEHEDMDVPAAAPAAADPVADIRRQAAAELARIGAIRSQFAGRHSAVEAKAVAEGWSADKARAEFLAAEVEALRAGRPQVPAGHVKGHDKDCTLQALQGAMLLRSRGRLDHPGYRTQAARAANLPAWLTAGVDDAAAARVMDAAHRYSDASLIDLAREALRLDGVEEPVGRSEMLKAAFSGSTLTNIFTTNVNAVLLSAYMEAGDTTGGWTAATEVADFKTQERPRVEIGPGLTKLPRGGEADHASYEDTAESYRIYRYARQFAIDEQDMIDDRMSVFSDTPRRLAVGAARVRPDLVYGILLANPTLTQTGRALFHATEGNLDTSAALAASTLKAAISAMYLFQENGVNLNLMPTHLIVPPALKWTAMELLNSTAIVIAGTAGSVTERGNANTLASENLQVVVDARLENGVTDPSSGTSYSGSSSTWFMASTMAHTIEVAYLRGTGRVPQVRSFMLDKGKYGMGWDVCLDIGAKALDWRGLHKATA